jgi:hypothetical protein
VVGGDRRPAFLALDRDGSVVTDEHFRSDGLASRQLTLDLLPHDANKGQHDQEDQTDPDDPAKVSHPASALRYREPEILDA